MMPAMSPNERPAPVRPSLVVVTGRPGSGKTTLAHALARAVRCPLICRDEIKEGFLLANATAGADDAVVTRIVFDAFFGTIALLLHHRVTLVAEAAFQHNVWALKLQPLREIASVRVIICHVDAGIAHARRIARAEADPARARFHAPLDAVAVYEAPRLDVATLTVDTSEHYRPSFEDIVAFGVGPDSGGG